MSDTVTMAEVMAARSMGEDVVFVAPKVENLTSSDVERLEAGAADGTYPTGPYTVASSYKTGNATFERLADAARCVAARRHHQPASAHWVEDADGFLIGRGHLEKALNILKREAEFTLTLKL